MNRIQSIAEKLTSRTTTGRGESLIPVIAAELHHYAAEIESAAALLDMAYIHAERQDDLDKARIRAGERLAALD